MQTLKKQKTIENNRELFDTCLKSLMNKEIDRYLSYNDNQDKLVRDFHYFFNYLFKEEVENELTIFAEINKQKNVFNKYELLDYALKHICCKDKEHFLPMKNIYLDNTNNNFVATNRHTLAQWENSIIDNNDYPEGVYIAKNEYNDYTMKSIQEFGIFVNYKHLFDNEREGIFSLTFELFSKVLFVHKIAIKLKLNLMLKIGENYYQAKQFTPLIRFFFLSEQNERSKVFNMQISERNQPAILIGETTKILIMPFVDENEFNNMPYLEL